MSAFTSLLGTFQETDRPSRCSNHPHPYHPHKYHYQSRGVKQFALGYRFPWYRSHRFREWERDYDLRINTKRRLSSISNHDVRKRHSHQVFHLSKINRSNRKPLPRPCAIWKPILSIYDPVPASITRCNPRDTDQAVSQILIVPRIT